MRELQADLFVVGRVSNALVLTTNGTVKSNGRAIMGRGVALTATQKFPDVDARLGKAIRKNGNVVQQIGRRLWYGRPYAVVAYPVKHHWKEEADYELILRSAYQLVQLTDHEEWKTVVLPRPGCGNGRLAWGNVKPLIAPILDDRFVIVNNEGERGNAAIICTRR